MSLESRLAEVSTDLKNANKSLDELKSQQKVDHDKIVLMEQAVSELKAQKEKSWQFWIAIVIAVVSAALSVGAHFLVK